jgi:hypothetical protein
MLGDQGDGAGPRRERVERLRQGHADHRADRVAGPTGPAGRLKLGDKPADLRAAEQRRDLYGVGAWCYRRADHGGAISWSRPPEVATSRGSLLFLPSILG